VNSKLEKKLKKLPTTPGVYFHKNRSGEIIYIGKAANLRNRVQQYYRRNRIHDPKTDRLIGEIMDTDWTELETEVDALFLEAELVRRYLPRYNILLRDDKSLQFVHRLSKRLSNCKFGATPTR
jgi:excinuclease ABC subunit C